MGYLETLQSHNTRLSTLVDKANSLPEAGGGGGGGSEWIDVTALPATYGMGGGGQMLTRYLSIENEKLVGILFTLEGGLDAFFYRSSMNSSSWRMVNSAMISVFDESAAAGVNFAFSVAFPSGSSIYALPIYMH